MINLAWINALCPEKGLGDLDSGMYGVINIRHSTPRELDSLQMRLLLLWCTSTEYGLRVPVLKGRNRHIGRWRSGQKDKLECYVVEKFELDLDESTPDNVMRLL